MAANLFLCLPLTHTADLNHTAFLVALPPCLPPTCAPPRLNSANACRERYALPACAGQTLALPAKTHYASFLNTLQRFRHRHFTRTCCRAPRSPQRADSRRACRHTLTRRCTSYAHSRQLLRQDAPLADICRDSVAYYCRTDHLREWTTLINLGCFFCFELLRFVRGSNIVPAFSAEKPPTCTLLSPELCTGTTTQTSLDTHTAANTYRACRDATFSCTLPWPLRCLYRNRAY